MTDLDQLRSYVADAERRLTTDGDVDWVTPAPVRTEPGAVDAAIASAASLAHVGRLVEGTRMAGMKRQLLRALQLITRDQNAFNEAVVAALLHLASSDRATRMQLDRAMGSSTGIVASLDAAVAELGDDLARVRAALADLEPSLISLRERETIDERARTETAELGDRLSTETAELGDRLSTLQRDLSVLQGRAHRLTEELRRQDDRLTILLKEARARLPEPLDDAQLSSFSDQLSRRFDALYTEFENRFRGSRAEILERLKHYGTLLDLHAVASLGQIVDLGCGRGEWLEYLKAEGIDAYGIDVNQDIAALATERGLDVRVGDGLVHLRGVAAGSLAMVSMFHVAEHLEFETLVEVMRAARTALAPGGLLLIEAPNPTNLNVGASSFYLDPTHTRPLHPNLVEFLASASGFDDVKVHLINPPAEPRLQLSTLAAQEPELLRLLDHVNHALLGPLDFVVIARVPADADHDR